MTRRRPPVGPDAPEEPATLRRRAEARLGARKQPAAAPRSDAGSERLVHELEVHQIELEIQNEDLRQSRDQVEAALATTTDLWDFAPSAYFSLDEEGRILDVNLTGASLLGVERSVLVGRRLQRFMAASSHAKFEEYLGRVFEDPERQFCEVSLRGRAGARIEADLRASVAGSLRGARRWCRLAAVDISPLKRAAEAQARADAVALQNQELRREIARRKHLQSVLKESGQRQTELLKDARRLERQLRQLSRATLRAQEEERARVSRELHDVVAQAVIGVKIHVELSGGGDSRASRTRRNRVAQTQRALERLLDVVHRFCRELRPPVLDDLGLNAALRSFTKTFRQRTGIDVRLRPVEAADRLGSTGRTVLYRVAQEALANVARHAHAGSVSLTLSDPPGAVCLEIADDGRGFDVDHVLGARRRSHLGLLGMRERVEMVGGTIAIESAPGKGTSVRAQVPLAADPAARAGRVVPARR